ncbi:MAG: hypothetical protein FJ030_13195 [Chloroflexi bacterium]|nr:hypothetical protein [Chloroflexota bacterium]
MITVRSSRGMEAATHVAATVMCVVGALGLPHWGLRLAAALCAAFCLLHAFFFNRLHAERRAIFYFAIQAALLVTLLTLGFCKKSARAIARRLLCAGVSWG